jgi:hypothetical protein
MAEAFLRTFPNINLIPTTGNETENITSSIKLKRSYDCDEISTKLLETYTDYTASIFVWFHTIHTAYLLDAFV